MQILHVGGEQSRTKCSPENFTGKNAQMCSGLSHVHQTAVSSQYSHSRLHLNRLCWLMLCPTGGPRALPPCAQGSPQPPFPRAFGEARSQTWVVALCSPWLFLHSGMQLVCRVAATLKEAVSLFIVWLSTVVVLLWIKICFCSFFFLPLSKHTHVIFASQAALWACPCVVLQCH